MSAALSMLGWCWTDIAEDDPTLIQHWVVASLLVIKLLGVVNWVLKARNKSAITLDTKCENRASGDHLPEEDKFAMH